MDMAFKIGAGVFTVLVLVVFLIFQKNNQNLNSMNSSASRSVIVTPSSSPIPFYEITIPYLRSREYKSQIGELRRIEANSSYTSFLTNYDSEGLKIDAQLTEPEGEMPEGGWPAIIFIHGYIPPKSYQTLKNYVSYVDYLASQGFVVFKIDLRGHGSSEGEPSGAYYSSDYIIDVLNAYSALQSVSFVNSKKIGLWGHSMAGNVVMRSLATKTDIPAVVIWAGAVYSYLDHAEFGIDDNSYQPPQMSTERIRKRQELLNTYGQPKDGNPFWQQVAPTNFLKDIKGAIQIHHAIDDSVVNIGYSRNLNYLLNQTTVAHELNEYRSGGHDIEGSSFSEAMKKTVAFFNQYLK